MCLLMIMFFLTFLEVLCKRNRTQFACRAVVRTSSSKGLVQQDPPLRAQKVEKVVKRIQEQFEDAKSSYEQGNHDKWENAAGSLLKQLRITWERAVEEVVEPVLKRFSNEVKTDGLVKLTVLIEEDCQTMRAAFKRLSKSEHSSADNKPTPTPEDIEKEIKILRDWFTTITDRQRKAKN